MMPLVRASGTGKVSSTVNANATGVIGTTVAPIKNIVINSIAGFLNGSDKKWTPFVNIDKKHINCTIFL
jgi:hypothetical protein